MGLAKLRLDGFCSLNAGPVREGILITRRLASPGTGIEINAECGQGGYVDAEVFSQADEVLPGYSRKDFDRFTGTRCGTSFRGNPGPKFRLNRSADWSSTCVTQNFIHSISRPERGLHEEWQVASKFSFAAYPPANFMRCHRHGTGKGSAGHRRARW